MHNQQINKSTKQQNFTQWLLVLHSGKTKSSLAPNANCVHQRKPERSLCLADLCAYYYKYVLYSLIHLYI